MIPTNVALVMVSAGLIAVAVWVVLQVRGALRERRRDRDAEEQRVAEFADDLHLADLAAEAEQRAAAAALRGTRAVAVARLPTKADPPDDPTERTSLIDVLGYWQRPESLADYERALDYERLLDAPIPGTSDGAELVVVEPPPFPRRPRRGRLAAIETATGPGWVIVGPTPARKTQEVA